MDRHAPTSGLIRASRALLLCTLAAASCSSRAPSVVASPTPATAVSQTGVASWYGPGFHGKPTASGEAYDQNAMTAAHRTLPLGTRVRVTNLSNSRTVDVRINDRGPFVGDRIIDLSQAAAAVLEMIGPGTARVRIDVIGGAVRVDSIRASLAYTVQVASFSQRANAEELRSRLARTYPDVRVGEAEARGSIVYRVYVGEFPTRAAAEREAQRLSRDGLTAIVVER